MSIGRKAFSVGVSAALLASLLITAAAPAALASISQTSAGNVAQGTTSAGTATFLFTENGPAALTTTGTMTVTILDSASNPTVTWAGTPVVSAPGSLGASASLLGNQLNIAINGYDNANVETISITGLKVKASGSAAAGAVRATISDNAGNAIYTAFTSGTTTATGRLAQAYGIGTTSFIVANDPGSCFFGGTNAVTVGSETLGGIGVSPINTPVAGQQTITSAASATSHLANEVVSQTVPNCNLTALASPANVVQAASVSYDGPLTVYPGESNSSAGDIYLEEPAAGFLAGGTKVTYTLATDGVVFSGTPSAHVDGGNLGISAPTLAPDRKSFSITVTGASSTSSDIHVDGIRYDVAASVAGGTFIDVNVSLSGGLLVVGNPAENAVVFRGIDASAPTPTVYIGENNQATGLVTLSEKDAGFFQSGTGPNNVIAVCTTGVNYSFTFAPWAKVTAGDLRLRDGATASATNVVQGAQDGNCYTWTVWSGSTVASTIVIGNSSAFTSGPMINVAPNQAPGLVMAKLYSGNGASYTSGQIATVAFAVAAFRNQVAVTALSQPVIPAGATSKAGGIQISETANGQLKRWEDICVEIVPRGGVNFPQAKYDTYIQSLNTAQLPVVTSTGGLLVGPVELYDQACADRGEGPGPVNSSTKAISFSFDVYQQSTSGNGKLVIDNINLTPLADAFNGPVLMNVYGFGGSPTMVQFQAQVSNAKIGNVAPISIGNVAAAGLWPKQGPWSTKTPVVAKNTYITWRFSGGSALAGKDVEIWVATKNSAGGWSDFVKVTSRKADASGNALYWFRSSGKWISVRAHVPAGPTNADSWSAAVQGRYR